MSILAFFSLFASVVCFTFGLTVHFLSKKNLVNLVFMFLCLSISYWAFTDFMVLQAETLETATFWHNSGFLWPFTSAFLFHFSIVFTDHKAAVSRKSIIFLTYAFALFFSILHLTTNSVSCEAILENGYYFFKVPENSLFFWFSTFWLFLLSVFGLYILIKYYGKQTNKKRKQAQLVVVGFSFPILISILTEIFPLILNVNFPNASALPTTILCVFVGISIWKYGLFSLDIVSASETIISIMPDSFVLVDSTSKILSINNRLVNLLGYTEKELVSQPITILFEEQFGSDIFGRLSIQQEIKNYDVICKTKSGELVPVAVSASIIRDDSEVVGAVVVVRDISEKKRMETLLLKSEKMAALGQAATMVGHDLRNPLQAIQNSVYCIKQDLIRNSVGGSRFAGSFRMLEIIENAIAYSDNIVMDLKDFSTERKPELVPVDLNQLINEALESTKLPETVEIDTDLDSLPFVELDKTMVKRTFVNILTNGAQAMPDGGAFKISTSKMDNFVCAKFQDNGKGMSEETLKKLFTPFFTTKAQGMGMGLAICKKFIKLNGGSIEVDSKEGKGTTFEVKLPVKT